MAKKSSRMRRLLSGALSAVMLATLVPSTASAIGRTDTGSFLTGPYLMTPKTNGMVVVWELDKPMKSTLKLFALLYRNLIRIFGQRAEVTLHNLSVLGLNLVGIGRTRSQIGQAGTIHVHALTLKLFALLYRNLKRFLVRIAARKFG